MKWDFEQGWASSTLVACIVSTAIGLIGSQPVLALNLSLDTFAGFSGQGLSPGGLTTEEGDGLDSNQWAFTGFSDGDTTFGSTALDGDYARGISAGSVSSGGLYAFDLDGDRALGVQATSSDFSPGSIVRRVENTSEDPLTTLTVSYEQVWLNNGDRSSEWLGEWSVDSGATWISVPQMAFQSPGTKASAPEWQRDLFEASIALNEIGSALAPGDSLLWRWRADDLEGSGGRDEIGIDNVRFDAAAPVPLPAAVWLFLGGLAALWKRLGR